MTAAELGVSRVLHRLFSERELQHIVEYADQHFYLSGSSSQGNGQRWTTYGYQRFPLHASADLGTHEVTVIKPTQVGLSKLALILLMYESEHRDRSNGIWLPRRSDADEFSNVQIASALQDIKLFGDALKTDVDKKDKDNTTRRRAFDGAQSYCRATQTPQDVSSITVSTAILDELSKMPRTIKQGKDDEGISPTDGVRDRMDSERRWKLNKFSTPLEFETCAITEQFEGAEHEFERFHKCPSCGNHQIMVWGEEELPHGFKITRVLGKDGQTDELKTAATVHYVCEFCKKPWYYRDMTRIDQHHAEYRSEHLRFDEKLYKYFEKDDLKSQSPVPSPYSVGIQIRGWMSRTKTWQQGMYQFLQAAHDRKEGKTQKLVNWTQNYKSEAYRPPESVNAIDHLTLFNRRTLLKAECPEWVQQITGWWDLQQAGGGYIYGLYVGWGYGEECCLLWQNAPLGCPIRSTVMEDNIAPMMERVFVKPSGAQMPVALTGIDAGWQGDLAHDFSKKHGMSRVLPTFGNTKINGTLATMPTHPNSKTGTFLTELCPDTAKTTIYTRYKIDQPGPGYIHIPELEMFGEDFCKQLVSERQKVKNNQRRWTTVSKVRNEALDCMVGNLGLMKVLQGNRFGVRLIPDEEYKQIIVEDENLTDQEDPMQALINAAKGQS